MIIVLSWLMVSNLPLMALKFKDFSIKNNLPKIILMVLAIVAGIFLKWLAVPLVFVAYIILSLAFKNKTT
jgi:CDP-diacylglycerol--serine O-phosphatidyltransferase